MVLFLQFPSRGTHCTTIFAEMGLKVENVVTRRQHNKTLRSDVVPANRSDIDRKRSKKSI